MTMLNEEIIKELAKYDELFNGFSYNDIIQEKDEEAPEEEQAALEEPAKPDEKSADSSEDEALAKPQLSEAKAARGSGEPGGNPGDEAMEERTPEKQLEAAPAQNSASHTSHHKASDDVEHAAKDK
jgi:hypothetical protein